ncbi:MAG: tRNA (N6-isopentenyl adenosine(37)-C2)-methylthiotransferase MiaB [Deltaproteobacteria bacterium]|nr:tRNA (N6-isopentenyl adenosine(37)-C2)-methylthiotransferase MiaB [Deltaproteobacteria bacterium]
MKRLHIETFGCQMNAHDSERVAEVMRRAGYEMAATADQADLLIFNTCSIRESAENKLYSVLGRLRPLKERRSDLIIAVGGCVGQQQGHRLLRRVPHLDVVFGPDDIPALPDLVLRIQHGFPPIARTELDTDDPFFLPIDRAKGEASPSAFVTIMKGCDERCTFCIVPHVRGPERYRAAADVKNEVARLCAGGVSEVVLLGQTVNSYDGGCTFAELLARLDRVEGLRRLRYTSPHPRHVDPAVARAHAELPSLCEHVHLPVQSGSDRVLRRMLRRHTRAEYLDRVRLLRDACPGLGLTTDFIVGFPGEMPEDFEATLSLVEEVRFDGAFSFKFSRRPGTAALDLEDDVPEAEKDRRLALLMATVDGIAARKRQDRLGEVHEVLITGPSKLGGTQLTGRTRRNDAVNFHPPPDRAGDSRECAVGAFVPVELMRVTAHAFEGRLAAQA